MSPAVSTEIGGIIRRVRKRRRLRLEDLADENISPATISNLERGVPHVKQDKLDYLLDKLGISMDQIPELILEEKEELKNLKFQLFSCESLVSIGKPDNALEKLSQLEVEDTHPHAALYHYIQGKSYRSKKNWKKAERSLYQAVRIGSQTRSDLEAAAFNELSLCSYYQNRLEQALKYAESGIASFEDTGERPQIKYLLRRNKAIYLERLGRLGEAMKVVNEAWEWLPQIEQIETKLSFYWLQSELSRRTGVWDQAVHYAETGLELARLNQHYSMMFDFWTVLANTAMKLEDWKRAEHCFSMALELKGRLRERYEDKMVSTYTYLGKLYIRINKLDAAYQTLQKAIRLGELHQDIPRLTYALQIMGDYHRLQDEKSEAIPYYRRELDLAQKNGLKQRTYQATLHLAQCLEGVDEKEFQHLTRNVYTLQVELQDEEGMFIEEN